MKKICFLLFTAMLFQQAISQTETFDIITYTPPKDWKKEVKQGVVNFTTVNAATGGFCVIAIYASRTSTGDPEKDFKKGWMESSISCGINNIRRNGFVRYFNCCKRL
jgi:hypothetical protein